MNYFALYIIALCISFGDASYDGIVNTTRIEPETATFKEESFTNTSDEKITTNEESWVTTTIKYDEDVDECATGQHNCLPNSQKCVNTVGSYHCVQRLPCGTGYLLDDATGECLDIDECALNIHHCEPKRTCYNTEGSFHCVRQKSTTEQILQSEHQDYDYDENIATPEEYWITTPPHYYEEFDACATNMHNCSSYERCLNTNSSYECVCLHGYERDVTGECIDVDECKERINNNCSILEVCFNTNGSYECHCAPGTEQNNTSSPCVDVDECATGQHNCIPHSQKCVNTVGSYYCVRILPCGTGYLLNNATGECLDIDECALNIHHCGPKRSCYNTKGSFRCLRQESATEAIIQSENDYYDENTSVVDSGTKDNSVKEEIIIGMLREIISHIRPNQIQDLSSQDTEFIEEIENCQCQPRHPKC